jgi:hypothetical protein
MYRATCSQEWAALAAGDFDNVYAIFVAKAAVDPNYHEAGSKIVTQLTY